MTAQYPFEGHKLDIKGHKYHYLDEGDGEPMLMVHGNPTWSFYYRNLVKHFSGRFRTIVPDHIGCGRSDKPGEDDYHYTLATRVSDLEALAVDHLDLKDITLVVHDWGGMIGMAFATRHVARIKRLIIFNTAAFHLPESKAFPAALRLTRFPLVGEALVRGFSAFSRGANRFCVTRRPLPREVAAAYLEPYDSWDNRLAVHRFVTDIPLDPRDPAYSIVTDTENNLHDFKDVPKTFIWGMKDFVFDRHFLAEWVKRFPDAPVHRFEDAGHYILEDALEDILPILDDFVAEEVEA